MEIALGEWRLRTDPAENARDKVPYLRGCQSCRNFLATVETLPGETHAFFRRLGLDIRCPTEALVSGPLGPDGCCDYRVWYDFSGELLRAPGDGAPYPAAPGPRVLPRGGAPDGAPGGGGPHGRLSTPALRAG